MNPQRGDPERSAGERLPVTDGRVVEGVPRDFGFVPSSLPDDPTSSTIACGKTCPAAEFTWAIPAGLLNFLWSDVFPRLVARSWLPGPPAGAAYVGMDTPGLLDALKQLRLRVSGSASVEYLHDLQALIALFSAPACPPFRLMGEGGYDFVLSDWGVEFYMPEKPKTAADLLRYYTFRRTGRPAIGLPLYLQNRLSAVATDSPTGPGQPAALEALILGQLSGVDTSCEEYICLVNRLNRLATVVGHDKVIVGLDSILCALGPFRCWQLEGSVYRGMMTEIPRIIATAWIEIQDGTTGKEAAYHPRVFDAVLAPRTDGLRSLFKERLETTVPNRSRMLFELQPAAPPPGIPWSKDDVVITNCGFFFPGPEQPAKDPATGAPASLRRLIQEIEAGRAGNPVFTDSKRTRE